MSRPDWQSRLIDIASLDTSLRRVLVTLYAILLGFAVIAAVRPFLSGPFLVAEPGINIPLSVVLISGLGFSFALTLLLAGISIAKSAWRFLAIIPIVLISSLLAVPIVRDPYGALYVLAGLFFIFASVILIVGPTFGWAKTMRWSGILFLAITTAATGYTVFVSSDYAATIVFVGLGMTIFIIEPALMVVGFDLAEISAFSVAPWLKRFGARHKLNSAIWRWTIVIFAIWIAYWLHSNIGGASFVHEIALRSLVLALLAFGICWGMWTRDLTLPSQHETLGYWHIYLISACLLAMSFISTADSLPKEGYLNNGGAHKFSVIIPKGWSETSIGKLPKAGRDDDPLHWTKRILAPTGKKIPRLAIVGVTRPPHAVIDRIPLSVNDLEGGPAFEPMFFNWSAPDKNGWRYGEQIVSNKKGNSEFLFRYWLKEVPTPTISTNTNWYIVCGIPTKWVQKFSKDCDTVQQSFWQKERLTPSPWGEFLFEEFFWFAFVGCGLALIYWSKRAEPILWLTIWVACIIGSRNLGVAGMEYADVFRDRQMTADIMVASILVGTGALILCEIQATRKPGTGWIIGREIAQSFVLTIIFLIATFLIYYWASKGSDYSAGIKGAVICLALTWDLWTSGGSMTNRSGPTFSRPSRILIFGGYLLIISSATIIFSEMNIDFIATKMESWDADGLAIAGLYAFGLAFAFMRHAERLARSLPRSNNPKP